MDADTIFEWIWDSLAWICLGVLGALVIFTIFVFLKRLIEVWRFTQLGQRFSQYVINMVT